MACVRPTCNTWIALAFSLLGIGCARQAAPAVPAPQVAPATDGSSVCEGLADRFVGLPALAANSAGSASGAPPLAGRWWIRRCSSSLRDGELQVRLQGPGWYFVNENGADLSLHQQVPFDLGIELDGRVNAELVDGVFSLWLTPDKEPKVELQASQDLDVRASSAWGAILRSMPLVSVRAMAADRFTDTAVNALRIQLREGATTTYDFGLGQGDATLGKLARGRTPERAYRDRIPWLVNDRLLLAPSSVHVLGPIAPGPTRLDVNVERGEGVVYQAVCAKDMPDSYTALATGHVADVPSQAVVTSGTVMGLGPHITDFRVSECRFYLVVSALRGSPSTLASLRVRA